MAIAVGTGVPVTSNIVPGNNYGAILNNAAALQSLVPTASGDNAAAVAGSQQNNAAALQQSNQQITGGAASALATLQPTVDNGTQAQAAYNTLMGLQGGNGMSSDQINAYVQGMPGYQFQQDQGMQQESAIMAARGLNNSGAEQEGLLNVSQGIASQYYQQATQNLLSYLGITSPATLQAANTQYQSGTDQATNTAKYAALNNALTTAQIAATNQNAQTAAQIGESNPGSAGAAGASAATGAAAGGTSVNVSNGTSTATKAGAASNTAEPSNTAPPTSTTYNTNHINTLNPNYVSAQ